MKELLYKSAIIGWSFIILSMTLVLFLARTKTVVIAGNEQSSTYDAGVKTQAAVGRKIEFRGGIGESAIRINLPSGVTPEQISEENRYLEHRLLVKISGDFQEFYQQNQIQACGALKDAFCGGTEKETILDLSLDRIYEYDIYMDNESLRIDLLSPSEKYDRILLLYTEKTEDAIGEEILTGIAERVSEISREKNICVYRLSGSSGEQEARTMEKLAEESQADLFLGVVLGKDTDVSRFGTETIYDNRYYMPGLKNSEFADLVEKSVTVSVNGKVLGITETQNLMPGNFEIPAVVLIPGFASNPEELRLMEQPSYQEKIGDGILEALESAFEKFETQ